MGHKTHPVGFRLGVTQNYQSSWYSKPAQYSSFLKEDYKIRKKLFSFLLGKDIKDSGISQITIGRNMSNEEIQIDIFTALPGRVVGKSGVIFGELKQQLYKMLSNYKKIKIDVREIKQPFKEASLVADYIIIQLEKRVQFKRVMKQAIEEARTNGKVEGIKIEVSGRLNGSEIARSEWLREGRVPLQTLRANIDYSSKIAKTIYGIMGVKVWLFKGEIFD